MIQHGTYTNGGYYLHKVLVERREFSAWYSSDGKLLDCEETTHDDRKDVRKASIRSELQRIGLQYKGKQP